jgi:DNA repair protein RecO (recombination protein O)
VSDARRIQLQPAYVLHHRPYRDTSRILELFTRDHGRVSVFARGARGSGKSGSSSLIPVLQPFNRLLVSWSGRGEAGQLTGAEFDGAMQPLPPDRLVHGFYLNELLLKLFARHDSHPDVFALYSQTLDQLKHENPVRPLRLFEKRLLDALGYGLALERDAHDYLPIEPGASYHYRIEQGPVRVHAVMENTTVYSGAMLLSLAREELSDAAVCADARRLLRAALDRCLDGRELRTRQVMLALRKGK